jgi:hypothetical protein
MNEPWYDANLFAWIPGTLFGVFGGLWGTLLGVLGSQGKAKGLVVGLFWVGLAVAGALLVIGIAALVMGQPYGIWYGLGLPGLLGCILFPTLYPVMKRTYQLAEARRIQAKDLDG